jgi:DNA-binding MarR family transcriptional regulator
VNPRAYASVFILLDLVSSLTANTSNYKEPNDMPFLMLKDLPRYECLLHAAERYPSLDPTACEAFLHLLRTADSVHAAESATLADKGLSQGRFGVLMLLNGCMEKPSTPAELADAAGVTRATMTGLVDTLERDGFVIREPDLEDRRVTHVRLTQQGQDFLDGMLPDYFRVVSAIIQPLSETERKQLVRLLMKIQQGLSPEPPAATGSPAMAKSV